jgi:hypothetical protein
MIVHECHTLLIDLGTLHERGGMERRLIRRGPWSSVVSQQQNCKDDKDQDAKGCNQECHPPPRLWIASNHDETQRRNPKVAPSSLAPIDCLSQS